MKPEEFAAAVERFFGALAENPALLVTVAVIAAAITWTAVWFLSKNRIKNKTREIELLERRLGGAENRVAERDKKIAGLTSANHQLTIEADTAAREIQMLHKDLHSQRMVNWITGRK